MTLKPAFCSALTRKRRMSPSSSARRIFGIGWFMWAFPPGINPIRLLPGKYGVTAGPHGEPWPADCVLGRSCGGVDNAASTTLLVLHGKPDRGFGERRCHVM